MGIALFAILLAGTGLLIAGYGVAVGLGALASLILAFFVGLFARRHGLDLLPAGPGQPGPQFLRSQGGPGLRARSAAGRADPSSDRSTSS